MQIGANLAHDGGVVALAQMVSVLVYLLPVAAVLLLCARRDRRPDELAALIPAAVAIDLLAVLVLCRVMRLELAALVTRLAWIAGAALWFDRRLRRRGLALARPAALDRRALVGLALAVAAAATLSAVLSRPFAIWDRELHIPFVASLRGQHIPFANAYEPGVGFHYHFTGDVLASMFQIFSFDVIHSSLALSLAHDVMFGLIALTVGLALLASGPKPVHVLVLGVAAVLLSGPCVLRFGVGEPYLGYSYYALYIWGFRPHQHLAMLMFAGIASVLVARSREATDLPLTPPGARLDTPALVAMMCLLPITDETSAAVLGFCLAVAWLADPLLLAPTRRRGAWLLGGMALAFVATNLIFEASLSRGSPVQRLSFVAPRSPGVQQPPLPLSTAAGWIALAADTLPVWAILLALVLRWVRRGGGAPGARPSRGFFVFAVVLAAAAILGLTTLDVNGAPPESHRFLTAALFLFPVFGVLAFDGWRPGSFGRTLVLAALALGAGSTLLWLSHYPRHPTPERYFRQRGHDLHATDCRALAGARVGQTPAVTYVESSVFYSYVGCRPSFVAGKQADYWPMKQRPTSGVAALQQLHAEMLKPDAPVDAICPAGRRPADVDAVCAWALAHVSCAPDGADFVRCPLSPGDRRTILGRH